MPTLRIYRPSRRRFTALLFGAGAAGWLALAAAPGCADGAQARLNSFFYLLELLRGSRLHIAPKLQEASARSQVVSLVAQVRLNGRVVAQSTRQRPANWSIDLPVRPAGELELRVVALGLHTAQRCVLASGLSRLRASGEPELEMKVELIQLRAPYCVSG